MVSEQMDPSAKTFRNSDKRKPPDQGRKDVRTDSNLAQELRFCKKVLITTNNPLSGGGAHRNRGDKGSYDPCAENPAS